MQKLIATIGLNFLLAACGVNGPPVAAPAQRGEAIPASYPPEDPLESQIEARFGVSPVYRKF